MNYFNLSVYLFIILAFVVGSQVEPEQMPQIHKTLNNASATLNQINLEGSPDPYVNGTLLVIEKFFHYLGTFFTEVARAAITFGSQSPQYFEPTFILNLVRFILIAIIVGLLIKPLFYLGVIIVLLISWIWEKKRLKKVQKKQEKV